MAVLCVLVLIAPSAYVVQEPGPTQDVLGKVEGKQVIDVSGVKTHKDSGKLLLVTVNASGVPGYPVTNAQALLAWANPKATVIPQEAVVPRRTKRQGLCEGKQQGDVLIAERRGHGREAVPQGARL